MEQNMIEITIDADRFRKWIDIVNPYLIAIRPPEVFEEMGFPSTFVRRHVQTLLSVGGHGSPGSKMVRGISDAVFLRSVARAIGADTSEGDRWMSLSNKIPGWQKACAARFDEIIREHESSSPEPA